jgi:hypothetical protein
MPKSQNPTNSQLPTIAMAFESVNSNSRSAFVEVDMDGGSRFWDLEFGIFLGFGICQKTLLKKHDFAGL